MREGFFFMIQQIVKRDGRMAPFEIDKITNAIFGAAQASGGQDHDMAQELAEQVEKTLEETAGTCPRSGQCRTLALWQGLDKVIQDYLESVTIADLIEQCPAGDDYVI